jgi:ABC-type branched-subunit amino acid transport system permease subunit
MKWWWWLWLIPAVVALTAIQSWIARAFDLSQEQAGWLDTVIFGAIVLGVMAWRR